MTSTLEQLKQDVAARRKQVADSARVQRQIDQERSLAEFRAKIESVLLPVALLDELQAEFTTCNGHSTLIVHYRGATEKYTNRLSLDVATVVDWTTRVDCDIAEDKRKRATAHARIAGEIPQADSLRALQHLRTDVKNLQFNDLTQALDAKEAELQATREAEIAKAVAQVEAATENGAIDNAEWNYASEPRVTEAVQAARERLHQATVEREERRAQAEQDAFWPFRVWRLEYGIVVGEDGTHTVETDTTYVTAPEPDEAGCFLNPYGVTIHIYHPVCAQMIDVYDFEDMERVGCCHRVNTPDGWIHVPPAACQRL